MASQILSHARLLELLHYNPDTGVFTWAVNRRGRGGRKGEPAGCDDGKGYMQVMIEQKLYLCHRLAWFYMTKRWPEYQIDHINRVKSDNRWSNLREATIGQNQQNRPTQKNNRARAPRGVCWSTRDQVWMSYICKDGKNRSLGVHDNIIDAVAARMRAERKEFSHSPLFELSQW